MDSPEVRAWIEFAEDNNTLPEFPLPLGDPNEPTVAEMVGEMIMDADQTARFEAACANAGVRFVGGLFACTAKVEHEFTGAATYYGLTRGTPAARRTISRPGLVHRPGSDHGPDRRDVVRGGCLGGTGVFRFRPEACAGLLLSRARTRAMAGTPRPNFPVHNFLHGGAAAERDPGGDRHGFREQNRHLLDGRFSHQLTIYVFLYDAGTAMAVLGPDNPVAEKSIARYIGAMGRYVNRSLTAGTGARCVGSSCDD